MTDIMEAYVINAGGCNCILCGEQVMQEIRHEVYEVLKRHKDELIDYNWTLNPTYKEDGRQVIICYPEARCFTSIEEVLPKMLTSKVINIHDCLFTTERHRKEVERLCKAVAVGEIEPKGVLQ